MGVFRPGRVSTAALVSLGCLAPAWAQYPPGPQVAKDGTTVLLQDYASLPLSSRTTLTYPPPINFAGQLGRVNFLQSEPANAPRSQSRFFVNDMNRNLYILDKTTRAFMSYINFEEVFPKFDNNPGFAGGVVTFAFDPDYAANGRFFTVHTEDPNKSGSAVPTNASLPGLDLGAGYTITSAIDPPAGTVVRQAVLVEWTDTNRDNATFEGTAREILRVGFNSDIHPMGDLRFNPLAQPGDADYGNLYIAVGDGGAGETYGATRSIPQRLDALPGKILRITPDTALRPGDELGANGRYRIPTTGSDPNPFAFLSLAGLKKEIWAYGFRNPHRMSWDPVFDKLIVTDIGLNSWEEVVIVARGSNHGYSEREGTEQLFVTNDANNGKTGSQASPPAPFPDPDTLTVGGIALPVTPAYPVAQYSHTDGDAISSGFVYRGSLLPQLQGKYIFGDITTARLFVADAAEMIARDDGERTSLAAVHELQVAFDDPHDSPDLGPVNRRLFDIVAAEYARKGGDAPGASVLPGGAGATAGNDPDGIPYGGGRADIRLAMGGDGEIYVLSKSDGMIRQLVAVVPPTVTVVATDPTATEAGTTSGTFTISRTGSTAAALTVSYTAGGSATPGSDYAALTGSVTIPAAAASATVTVIPVNDTAVEPDETVVLSLTGNASYLVGTPGSAAVTIVSDDANGSGLTGQYYNDPGTGAHFVTLVLTRTDPTVNFNWGSASPGPGVNAERFSVRWTGQVLAPVSGNYVFSTVSDDGVRLWVNGQLVIDNWTLHAPTTNNSAPVALSGGTKYAVRMEFFEQTSGAVARLLWSYPGQAQIAIPQPNLFPAAGSPNQPPTVNAGADQTITLPASANLAGSASDDGGAVTTTWSKLSGPGTVTFVNLNALSTTASFSASGSYTLRLTASDGALTSTDEVIITVNPANQAPVVNAGADQTITLPGTASLAGSASDDGFPGVLTTTWSRLSGPGTVSFANANALSTSASFSVSGTYVLRLTASDGALSSADDLMVTVNAAPGETGSGLRGQYYNDPGTGAHFVTLVLTRTDPTVNFNWGTASPGPGVTAERFSVRWTGTVLAPVTGNYTFTTVSDDGVRLWVNGQLVINNWTLHPPTTNNSAPVALVAGTKYAIRMEFFEQTSGAVARLLWSFPGQAQTVIPQLRLFP